MLGILPETQKAFVAAILDATWRRHVHQRINYLANVFIQQQSDLKIVTKPKKRTACSTLRLQRLLGMSRTSGAMSGAMSQFPSGVSKKAAGIGRALPEWCDLWAVGSPWVNSHPITTSLL